MTTFNKISLSLLLLPIIVFAAWLTRLSFLSNFEKVDVAVQGYDPKDFFSGYYMNLQLDWERTDCTQFAENICPKKDFDKYYNFYITRKDSPFLTEAVSAKDVKLTFSYQHGFEPIIVDLTIDGTSYKSLFNNNISFK